MARYEVFHSDGGHGGPFTELCDARDYARQYLEGRGNHGYEEIREYTHDGWVRVCRITPESEAVARIRTLEAALRDVVTRCSGRGGESDFSRWHRQTATDIGEILSTARAALKGE